MNATRILAIALTLGWASTAVANDAHCAKVAEALARAPAVKAKAEADVASCEKRNIELKSTKGVTLKCPSVDIQITRELGESISTLTNAKTACDAKKNQAAKAAADKAAADKAAADKAVAEKAAGAKAAADKAVASAKAKATRPPGGTQCAAAISSDADAAKTCKTVCAGAGMKFSGGWSNDSAHPVVAQCASKAKQSMCYCD